MTCSGWWIYQGTDLSLRFRFLDSQLWPFPWLLAAQGGWVKCDNWVCHSLTSLSGISKQWSLPSEFTSGQGAKWSLLLSDRDLSKNQPFPFSALAGYQVSWSGDSVPSSAGNWGLSLFGWQQFLSCKYAHSVWLMHSFHTWEDQNMFLFANVYTIIYTA